MLLGSVCTFAASNDEYITLETYSISDHIANNTQGDGGWYYCYYSPSAGVVDFAFCNTSNSAGVRWSQSSGSYPMIAKWGIIGGANNVDSNIKFVAPKRGMVRLRGNMYNSKTAQAANSDGFTYSVLNGDKVLWTAKTGGDGKASYDVITSVSKGTELHFRVNANTTISNEEAVWNPTVEYLDADLSDITDIYEYYQYDGENLKKLTYNKKGGYYADDDKAYMDDVSVMASSEFSLVKRLNITENGRYRVYGSMKPESKNGGGNVLTVRKNDEYVWSQYFPPGEKCTFDVRMLSKAGDYIDVYVAPYDYEGWGYSSFDCEITKFVGTLDCSATTVSGSRVSTVKTIALSDVVGQIKGTTVNNHYSVSDGQVYPMEYLKSNSAYNSTYDDGYISPTVAYPGSYSDSVCEYIVQEDGTIKFDGKLSFGANSDGVLAKIYHNGNLLWSNRVGEERSVRYDEPYDVSYFQNDIDATVNVKAGDVLKFTFNRWRLITGDTVNLTSVKMNYVTAPYLSKTTKWKIDQSYMLDTNQSLVYHNGAAQSANIKIINGKTCIAKADLSKIGVDSYTGATLTQNGVAYVSVRDISGKNVAWAANRYAILYDGISVMFGYPELSEIKAASEGGVLFE